MPLLNENTTRARTHARVCVFEHTERLRKEVNTLFNNILNTFCLRLHTHIGFYGKVSLSERGNPLPILYGLLIPISRKGILYAPS